MADETRALSCASKKPTGNLSLSFPRVTWDTSSTYPSVFCNIVDQSCDCSEELIDFRPPSTFITSRKVNVVSNKMAPVKKSKAAKTSESINSKLQLVVKSGKVN
jgi:hypothetical protein